MLKYFVIVFLALGLSACNQVPRGTLAPKTSAARLQSQSAAPQQLQSIGTLMVFPMDLEAGARNLSMPREFFDQRLREVFAASPGIEVVPGSGPAAGGRFQTALLPVKDRLALARREGSDSVLLTTLRDYVEREGSDIGAEKPAMVSFRMEVLRAADGLSVWSADYFFQDLAVTDNLLRAARTKSRAGWTTAKEVLLEGFSAAAQDLERQRAQAEGGS